MLYTDKVFSSVLNASLALSARLFLRFLIMHAAMHTAVAPVSIPKRWQPTSDAQHIFLSAMISTPFGYIIEYII